MIPQQDDAFDINPYNNTFHFVQFIPYEDDMKKKENLYGDSMFVYYSYLYRCFCEKIKKKKKKKKNKGKKKPSHINENNEDITENKIKEKEQKFLEEFKNRILNRKSYLFSSYLN